MMIKSSISKLAHFYSKVHQVLGLRSFSWYHQSSEFGAFHESICSSLITKQFNLGFLNTYHYIPTLGAFCHYGYQILTISSNQNSNRAPQTPKKHFTYFHPQYILFNFSQLLLSHDPVLWPLGCYQGRVS